MREGFIVRTLKEGVWPHIYGFYFIFNSPGTRGSCFDPPHPFNLLCAFMGNLLQHRTAHGLKKPREMLFLQINLGMGVYDVEKDVKGYAPFCVL